MGKNNKPAKVRARLYKQNPYCYYCGVLTVLIDFKTFPKNTLFPKNYATLEHLYDKLSGLRKHNVETPKVIACAKCNHKRGRAAQLLPENKRKYLISQAVGLRKGDKSLFGILNKKNGLNPTEQLFCDFDYFDRF